MENPIPLGNEDSFDFLTEDDPEIINNGTLIVGSEGVWFETDVDMYTLQEGSYSFISDNKAILPLNAYELSLIKDILKERLGYKV